MTNTEQERDDLVENLRARRAFLRQTVNGIDDEQAARRTTVSALCLGGLIKHVSATEQGWADFMTGDLRALNGEGPVSWEDNWRLLDGETLASTLAAYEEVAARTDELIRTLPDLDAAYPLPSAPWFKPGATRSVRQTVLHIIGETAQHAGHADIIRESLDGAKTMG